jgi:hypothetical protein
VKRQRRVESPEISGVVRDQHKIAGIGIAQDVPVLPSGLAGACDMLSLVSGFGSDCGQIDAQALIDQTSCRIDPCQLPAGGVCRRLVAPRLRSGPPS